MKLRIRYRALLPALYVACAIWPTIEYHAFQIEASRWAGWIMCYVTYPVAQQLYVSLNLPAVATFGMLFNWLNSKWHVGLPQQPSLGSLGLSEIQLAAIFAIMCVFWYGVGWIADRQRVGASLPRWIDYLRKATLLVTGLIAVLFLALFVSIVREIGVTDRESLKVVFAGTSLTWNAGIFFLLRHKKVLERAASVRAIPDC